ncbi:fasciclin-like arabinogalactan protein 12 [Mangifera indica]|uniref:fasciclin-like arabinogalactan protein 12 n=1 Tax=Mangifera indica TaxID=29780 RepID=UPI001CFB3990|nr:fasciclin-like arabinogalactan protein 12 [Mangifera indica]
MVMKQTFFSFLLLFLFHCTTSVAQAPIPAPLPPPTPPTPTASPPAPPLPTKSPPAAPTKSPPAPLVPAAAPSPSGPTNVTKILEKAKGFSLFIRLLKSTSVADQIEKQLNDSNNGVTIFAPTDGAFSSLSSGVLNSLNDEQKEELIQFHVLSSYIPLSQFQTVSNPLRTNAGDTSKYSFPLNVTAYPNSVNISTGLTHTSLSGTVYSDGQLAIYQLDKVLLPMNIFGAKPPSPAPSPTKRKKENNDSTTDDTTAADSSTDDNVNASGAMSLTIMTIQTTVLSGFAMILAIVLSL